MNSSRSNDRITMIGTGVMGAPMARRLLDAGFEVSVWNRTQSKAAPLAVHGAVVFSEASEAVRSADVVVTILATGEHALYESLCAAGGAELDHSALFLQIAESDR